MVMAIVIAGLQIFFQPVRAVSHGEQPAMRIAVRCRPLIAPREFYKVVFTYFSRISLCICIHEDKSEGCR